MQYEFIEAREAAGQSRNQAAVEIGCGMTTLFQLERNGVMPRSPLIRDALKRYIKKNKPKKEESNE